MPCMLASKSVVASVTRKGPDLEKKMGKIKTRVVGAAAYLLLALMDHFEIDVGPPSSDLERPFEP